MKLLQMLKNLFSRPFFLGEPGVDSRETPLPTDAEIAQLKIKYAPADDGW